MNLWNADEECQIVVTDSNAKMLSSELSTYLGGRYIEIHIQSLSYREFLTFHGLYDSDDGLHRYLGLVRPGSRTFGNLAQYLFVIDKIFLTEYLFIIYHADIDRRLIYIYKNKYSGILVLAHF